MLFILKGVFVYLIVYSILGTLPSYFFLRGIKKKLKNSILTEQELLDFYKANMKNQELIEQYFRWNNYFTSIENTLLDALIISSGIALQIAVVTGVLLGIVKNMPTEISVTILLISNVAFISYYIYLFNYKNPKFWKLYNNCLTYKN